jgi:hypothetical protein
MEKRPEGLHRLLRGWTKFRGMGLGILPGPEPSPIEGDQIHLRHPNISERWLDPENHLHHCGDEGIPHAQNDKLFSNVLFETGHKNKILFSNHLRGS